MQYRDMEHFANKMDNEGGFYEFVTGYGVRIEDLPDDCPEEVRSAIVALLQLDDLIRPAINMVWETL
jgi:hypothetical protein